MTRQPIADCLGGLGDDQRRRVFDASIRRGLGFAVIRSDCIVGAQFDFTKDGLGNVFVPVVS
jgi:F420-dependent methylenetetrahydromethanopterin dehydrogenase